MHFARALSVVAATTLLWSCGAQKTSTVDTANGTATVTQSGDAKTETITTKDGTITVGKVDTSSLGAPVYPGANQDDGGSIATTTDGGSNQMAAFKTTDPFGKVYDYYKAHMPAGSEKMKLEQSDSSVASFVVGDDKSQNQTSVMITGKTGETQIIISHGKTH